MNTQENNKMIAEFLGYENIGTLNHPMYTFYDNYFKDGNRSVEELCYHESWDWLMPVVEKCLEKHNNLIDGRDVIDTSYSSIAQALQVVSLKETYNAVVEFINQHKNK